VLAGFSLYFLTIYIYGLRLKRFGFVLQFSCFVVFKGEIEERKAVSEPRRVMSRYARRVMPCHALLCLVTFCHDTSGRNHVVTMGKYKKSHSKN
jgi:hypothetical protein